MILKAISQRYEREQRQLLQQECCDDSEIDGYLKDLTVLFGGGPGDWDCRGLNYLAQIPEFDNTDDVAGKKMTKGKSMIKRAIGGHYGQVPLLGKLAFHS